MLWIARACTCPAAAVSSAVLSRDEAGAVPRRRHFLLLDLSYETYRATIPLSEFEDIRYMCYVKARVVSFKLLNVHATFNEITVKAAHSGTKQERLHEMLVVL